MTMPDVAQAGARLGGDGLPLFPDLAALLNEAFGGHVAQPGRGARPGRGSADPVERVAFACEFLLRGVLATRARSGP